MKLHVILLIVSSFPILSYGQTSDSIVKQEVYNTIVTIGKAWSQNNIDTLEKYIDNDYKHTDVRGEILNRVLWLNYVKERKEKNIKNPNVEFEKTEIEIYDGFAIVTGINSFSGQAYVQNDTNSSNPRKLRYTQVLKKEFNIWKRIIFQATYIENQ